MQTQQISINTPDKENSNSVKIPKVETKESLTYETIRGAWKLRIGRVIKMEGKKKTKSRWYVIWGKARVTEKTYKWKWMAIMRTIVVTPQMMMVMLISIIKNNKNDNFWKSS